MSLRKMKLGETNTLQGGRISQTKVLADFESKGNAFQAIETITAALEQPDFRGLHGFHLKRGETVSVKNAQGLEAEFRVYKIVAGMIFLTTPSSYVSVSLADRLLMAWKIFTGDFFKK